MICPFCNLEHPAGIRYCPKTGKLVLGDQYCPHYAAYFGSILSTFPAFEKHITSNLPEGKNQHIEESNKMGGEYGPG